MIFFIDLIFVKTSNWIMRTRCHSFFSVDHMETDVDFRCSTVGAFHLLFSYKY